MNTSPAVQDLYAVQSYPYADTNTASSTSSYLHTVQANELRRVISDGELAYFSHVKHLGGNVKAIDEELELILVRSSCSIVR